MNSINIIGAGGIGSHLISMIKDDYAITVMDGDLYERKNLHRQNISLRDIGKNKAQAMAAKHNLHAYIPDYLKTMYQMKGMDNVICVPDNHACRLLAIDSADEYGFDLIIAGNETETANAMFYNRRMKGSTADPRVRYPEMIKSALAEGQNSCADVSVDVAGQTMAANIVAATLALSLAKAWFGKSIDTDLAAKLMPVEHIWMGTRFETRSGYEFE